MFITNVFSILSDDREKLILCLFENSVWYCWIIVMVLMILKSLTQLLWIRIVINLTGRSDQIFSWCAHLHRPVVESTNTPSLKGKTEFVGSGTWTLMLQRLWASSFYPVHHRPLRMRTTHVKTLFWSDRQNFFSCYFCFSSFITMST